MMGEKVQDAARRFAESYGALLAVRVLQIVGIPIILASIYWAAGEIVDLGRRMAVIESARVQGRVEIMQRIERLEASDTREREVLVALGRQISSVESTSNAILREIESMRRESILREQRNRP
jgi:hypothetical protein